jgi:hypothetical protein
MRVLTKVMAALVMVPAVLTQSPASALPCDNTRWCARYSNGGGGDTWRVKANYSRSRSTLTRSF